MTRERARIRLFLVKLDFFRKLSCGVEWTNEVDATGEGHPACRHSRQLSRLPHSRAIRMGGFAGGAVVLDGGDGRLLWRTVQPL